MVQIVAKKIPVDMTLGVNEIAARPGGHPAPEGPAHGLLCIGDADRTHRCGYEADVVFLNGDPMADITAAWKVHGVLNNGHLFYLSKELLEGLSVTAARQADARLARARRLAGQDRAHGSGLRHGVLGLLKTQLGRKEHRKVAARRQSRHATGARARDVKLSNTHRALRRTSRAGLSSLGNATAARGFALPYPVEGKTSQMTT